MMAILSMCVVPLTLGLILVGIAVDHYRRSPLPPAIPQFRKEDRYPWEYYRNWSRRLGPIISLTSYGATVVILCTLDAAVELLERRKAFACRPRWPMVELLGRQDNIGFTYYGERLRKMRRLLHTAVFTEVTEKWGVLLDEHSLALCHDLMQSPESFYEAAERVPQQLITQLAYGRAADADYIELAKKIRADTTEALQPGRWLINLIPAMRYIPAWAPGAGFKKWAEVAQEDFLRMIRTPFLEVKEEHERGIASSSFVRECLDNLPPDHTLEDERTIMSAAGSLFSAGTETITATILTFFALILREEQIQERAHEEIVKVIGTQRLSCLEDRASLPYINAIIQEVQRFHPAVPLIAHGNTEEDYYHGLRVPRKSWVLANVWAIFHDENAYKNPDDFNPERFLPLRGKAPPDPSSVVFGFGRRRCPGAEFANSFLFLVISRAITLFKILPEDPSHPPHLEFGLGLVSSPKPFTCKFIPRSAAQDSKIITT